MYRNSSSVVCAAAEEENMLKRRRYSERSIKLEVTGPGIKNREKLDQTHWFYYILSHFVFINLNLEIFLSLYLSLYISFRIRIFSFCMFSSFARWSPYIHTAHSLFSFFARTVNERGKINDIQTTLRNSLLCLFHFDSYF